MSKIAVIGMVGNSAFMPVEDFAASGETVAAKGVHFEPGGKGYNQAVAAARCGAEVSFLGAVGTEGYETIRDFALKEGITPALMQKPGQTAYATIVTNSRGDNCVTVYQGPALTAEDVETFAPYIQEADILLLNNEVPEQVNIRAMEIAKDRGIKVMINPAPARKMDAYLLKNAFLFTPNEHETAGLAGITNLVVTLGEKGSFLKQLGVTVPAVSAGKVVDTTGAGDTFNGALAVKLAEGADLKTAAEFAAIAAGISVTRPYAVTSIPTLEEIEQFTD